MDEFIQPDNRIGRIGEVTFSHDVYNHPDGFVIEPEGIYTEGATNWYGERREFFEFDNPVTMISIDYLNYSQLISNLNAWDPGNLIFELYDVTDTLIISYEITPTVSIQTLNFNNQTNVSKVVIDFNEGAPRYDDGRLHGWYLIDNITYNDLAIGEVPIPSSVVLLMTGMIIMLTIRKIKRQKSL